MKAMSYDIPHHKVIFRQFFYVDDHEHLSLRIQQTFDRHYRQTPPVQFLLECCAFLCSEKFVDLKFTIQKLKSENTERQKYHKRNE